MSHQEKEGKEEKLSENGFETKFPFPVVFISRSQCTYVQKRVAQLNRMKLMDMPEGAALAADTPGIKMSKSPAKG